MNAGTSEELDEITKFTDWHMTNLTCVRCAHRWSAAYSSEFKKAHPLHAVIRCPGCGSFLGVVPCNN